MKHDKSKHIYIKKKAVKNISNVDDLIKSELNNYIDDVTNITNFLENDYDEHSLHQMRVSLRKIKSLVYFFNNLLNEDVFTSIKNSIHKLISPTSKARDYDIVKSNYLSPAYLKNKVEYEEFMAHSLNEIQKLQNNTSKILNSNQYQNRLIDLRNLINNSNWDNLSLVYSRRSLGNYIEKRINKEPDSIYSKAKDCHHLPHKKLHHLRIKIKELRYVIEILEPFIKHYKCILKNLNNLQDILGEINDTYSAAMIIKDLNISEHLSSHHKDIKNMILNHRKSNIHKLKYQLYL